MRLMRAIWTGATTVDLQRTNKSQGLLSLFPAWNTVETYEQQEQKRIRSRSESELPVEDASEETFALDPWFWKKLVRRKKPLNKRWKVE